MKTCPACGTQNPDDALFCASCGQSIQFAASMFAPQSKDLSTPSSTQAPQTQNAPPALTTENQDLSSSQAADTKLTTSDILQTDPSTTFTQDTAQTIQNIPTTDKTIEHSVTAVQPPSPSSDPLTHNTSVDQPAASPQTTLGDVNTPSADSLGSMTPLPQTNTVLPSEGTVVTQSFPLTQKPFATDPTQITQPTPMENNGMQPMTSEGTQNNAQPPLTETPQPSEVSSLQPPIVPEVTQEAAIPQQVQPPIPSVQEAPMPQMPMQQQPMPASAQTPIKVKKWWEKWWGILLLVIIIGPIGAILTYAIWKSPRIQTTVKWALTVVIFIASWMLQIMLFGKR